MELIVLIVGYAHLIFYVIDETVSVTDDEQTILILGIAFYFLYAIYSK